MRACSPNLISTTRSRMNYVPHQIVTSCYEEIASLCPNRCVPKPPSIWRMKVVKTLWNRTKVWFPKIDAIMAERIATCIPCQAKTHSQCPEPLHMFETPDYAWQEVNADFYGPFQSGNIPVGDDRRILSISCHRSRPLEH